MKVLAINSSARGAKGNTQIALEFMKETLQAEEIETEIVVLAEKTLNPCKACYGCRGKNKCVQNDSINEIYPKLLTVDGILLGSPTYFSNVTSRMAMFIERTGIMARTNDNALKGKVGASIAIARRAGANVVYSAMNYYFGLAQVFIATSSYWNILIGREPGEIKNDKEGMETLTNLAKNMAIMLKKLRV